MMGANRMENLFTIDLSTKSCKLIKEYKTSKTLIPFIHESFLIGGKVLEICMKSLLSAINREFLEICKSLLSDDRQTKKSFYQTPSSSMNKNPWSLVSTEKLEVCKSRNIQKRISYRRTTGSYIGILEDVLEKLEVSESRNKQKKISYRKIAGGYIATLEKLEVSESRNIQKKNSYRKTTGGYVVSLDRICYIQYSSVLVKWFIIQQFLTVTGNPKFRLLQVIHRLNCFKHWRRKQEHVLVGHLCNQQKLVVVQYDVETYRCLLQEESEEDGTEYLLCMLYPCVRESIVQYTSAHEDFFICCDILQYIILLVIQYDKYNFANACVNYVYKEPIHSMLNDIHSSAKACPEFMRMEIQEIALSTFYRYHQEIIFSLKKVESYGEKIMGRPQKTPITSNKRTTEMHQENLINSNENTTEMSHNAINSNENTTEMSQNPINSNENTTEMPQNPINSNENTTEMSQNPINSNENTTEMPQNAINSNKNTTEMPQNAINSNENTTEMPQNAINSNENTTEMHQQIIKASKISLRNCNQNTELSLMEIVTNRGSFNVSQQLQSQLPQKSHKTQGQELQESSQLPDEQYNLFNNMVRQRENSSYGENMSEFSQWCSFLGLGMKFDPERHMPWRYDLQLYLLTEQRSGIMSCVVFRIVSFTYDRFKHDVDVLVSRLAQSGFFYASLEQLIVCFACENMFSGSSDSSPEDFHNPQCRRRELNTPFSQWTQGVNQSLLSDLYSKFGSLKPSDFVSIKPLVENTDTRTGASEVPLIASDSRQSEQADCGYSDSNRLLSLVEKISSRENVGDGYSFENLSDGLQSSLSDDSGTVVSQESQEPYDFNQITTSAARHARSSFTSYPEEMQNYVRNAGQGLAVGGGDRALDLRNASYPQFSNVAARMETFSMWNHEHPHRPEQLVSAGFFFAGYADCVRCFYCGLGLKFWKNTDIPEYEHARHRPECVYNRMYKGQDYIDRVQRDVSARQGTNNERTAQNFPAHVPSPARPAHDAGSRGSSQSLPSTPADPPHPPVEPAPVPQEPNHMNSMAAQEAIRNGWPREQVQQAVDYIVTHCGVHSLESDLLLDVLANFQARDNPEQLNLPSGGSNDSGVDDNLPDPSSLTSLRVPAAAVMNVADGMGDQAAAPAEEGAHAALPQARQAGPSASEVFMSLERENVLLNEKTICRICKRKNVSCIYLPCGHVIACDTCADAATICIFCSKQIIGTANIFLA